MEDFGITPLEALAAGTPVIAQKRGGICETMNERPAVFFARASTNDLVKAILSFEEKSFSHFSKEDLLNQAQKFSKECFKKNMQEKIEKVMQS